MQSEAMPSDRSSKDQGKESGPFANPDTRVALSGTLKRQVAKIGLQGDTPEPIIISFDDICAAKFRISDRIRKTPCEVRMTFAT